VITLSKPVAVLLVLLMAALVALAVLVTLVVAGGDSPASPASPETTVSPSPTSTPTPEPTPSPTATAVSPTPTPEPTAPPLPPEPRVSVPQPTSAPEPTPTPERVCTDPVAYGADIDYLNTLLGKIQAKLGLAAGLGYYGKDPIGAPCRTICDRQWLTTAITWAERTLQYGLAPGSAPMVPRNLCPR